MTDIAHKVRYVGFLRGLPAPIFAVKLFGAAPMMEAGFAKTPPKRILPMKSVGHRFPRLLPALRLAMFCLALVSCRESPSGWTPEKRQQTAIKTAREFVQEQLTETRELSEPDFKDDIAPGLYNVELLASGLDDSGRLATNRILVMLREAGDGWEAMELNLMVLEGNGMIASKVPPEGEE